MDGWMDGCGACANGLCGCGCVACLIRTRESACLITQTDKDNEGQDNGKDGHGLGVCILEKSR